MRHHRARVPRLVLALATALALVVPLSPAGAATTLPDSMAAIGDSITQAANLDGSSIGASNPEHSWSTGDDAGDVITSHYERILAANPAIAGNNHNVSVSGAKMDDAPGQAQDAVATGAEYVTFLMGGNDVCASSYESMTPVAQFEADARTALSTLASGLPDADVYLGSVPDVYQLWDLFKYDFYARFVWSLFGICQSMLSGGNSEADRQAVRQRNIEYNDALQRVCAEFSRCHYDGGAVFDYQFTKADVSSVDYFHPSKTGQMHLAEVTWASGLWPDS